jgi:hypothetical protein
MVITSLQAAQAGMNPLQRELNEKIEDKTLSQNGENSERRFGNSPPREWPFSSQADGQKIERQQRQQTDGVAK